MKESIIIPINNFVKCKNNNLIRYVTRQTDKLRFEDDGKKSGLEPSKNCYYKNYSIVKY